MYFPQQQQMTEEDTDYSRRTEDFHGAMTSSRRPEVKVAHSDGETMKRDAFVSVLVFF